MSNDKTSDLVFIVFLFISIIITGTFAVGDSLDSDTEVLLSLKKYLQEHNRVNQGRYSKWNSENSETCQWNGIVCENNRVTRVSLVESSISGGIFANFSALTALTHLDLSRNALGGPIPDDLSRCRSLKHLNLSHNILEGEFNLSGLDQLEILDLSVNRVYGEIQQNFPSLCANLVVANLSENNFTAGIDKSFDGCLRLKYLDLSSNNFSGELWYGFSRLIEFSVSENSLVGNLSSSTFPQNCSLQTLDLSGNKFAGEIPGEIANCRNLIILHLWGNKFSGKIPPEIGTISGLEALFLGDNRFSREIPESLLDLNRLAFLDLSKNGFGGEIQKIFGRFERVKFLVLHTNFYSSGINSSGILKLPKISRLDLSYNNFSGPLPLEVSEMNSLELLFLSHNRFNNSIPLEYGNFSRLQALDLSFNDLTGSIPRTLGKLNSLLWLMLANNSLAGKIPKELGDCASLLWINLANNKLSGEIPNEFTRIGQNAAPTFELNKKKSHRIIAGSGECLAMKRWIPADYPPFRFVYLILTRKNCRSIWDRLLKGVGLFPICSHTSAMRTLQVSGYVQLSGNRLTGEIPSSIGSMKNFSMLHFGSNRLSGQLPAQIGDLPLVVFNISMNKFSGEIPLEIGKLKCLQNLDLSYNNFSGNLPASLTNLTELSKFNVSYNPKITGKPPTNAQMATFDRDSYYGNPLLIFPKLIGGTSSLNPPPHNPFDRLKNPTKLPAFLVFIILILAFLICGVLSMIICSMLKGPGEDKEFELLRLKNQVKVVQLHKTAFTHADILRATANFSECRIIGKGGFGTVYRGTLSDGRHVAVKKQQREGEEGEREFEAEMEVLSQGPPHPNLVTLYGWCLDAHEKILVYEYMEGGSLEEVISDTSALTWRRRIDIAVDIARALVFLHHECYPAIVHRDVKAGNVLLGGDGAARVTDFGLARFVGLGESHVSTMVAGTVGYVAPEYGQTWRATTKGDVYSYGVLAMELATGRRAVDGGEECLVEWARRVGPGLGPGPLKERERWELLRVGVRCAAESAQDRPNMKEVLAMVVKIKAGDSCGLDYSCFESPG